MRHIRHITVRMEDVIDYFNHFQREDLCIGCGCIHLRKVYNGNRVGIKCKLAHDNKNNVKQCDDFEVHLTMLQAANLKEGKARIDGGDE